MKTLLIISSLLFTAGSFSHIDNEVKNISITKFDANDYSWLVGSWKGDGFGGISEETWSAPHNGTIMGMYRHIKDDTLIFYEFLLLNESGLRLKHFHPDLKGWEEKDETTFFEMIEYTPTKIVMKGLVFEKKSDDQIEIRLKLNRNGKDETEIFTMKRNDS